MTGPPFEPASLSELSRYVKYIMDGIDRQLTALSDKIDKLDVVPRSQYREDMAAMRERQREEIADVRSDLTDIRRDFEQFQSRLSSYGRWIIGSVFLPVIALILTVYSLVKGISL